MPADSPTKYLLIVDTNDVRTGVAQDSRESAKLPRTEENECGKTAREF